MTSKREIVELGQILQRKNVRLGDAAEPPILTCTENHGLVDQIKHMGKRLATEDASKYKVVDPGDIVYNVYLLWLGSIGQNVTGSRGITSPVYEVFTPSDSVCGPYIGLLLRSSWMVERYSAIAIGTVPRRRRTPWQDFLKLTVALPPLPEQRRIVDLIGALDDAIEAAEAKKDILECSRPQLLNSVLSGHETVLLQELLAGISAGKSPSAKNRPPVDGEYGVLKVGAVNMWGFIASEAKTLEHTSEFSESMKVKTGDLLMTRANTAEKVGAVCLVETGYDHLYLCDKTLRLEYIQSVEPSCLAAALNSEQVRSQIQLAGTGTSASMKNISQKSIGKLSVPWPQNKDEQRTIGELDSALLQSISESAEHVDSLRTLRSELLTALLSGAHEIPESYDEVMNAD